MTLGVVILHIEIIGVMTEIYNNKYRVKTARAQWSAYDIGAYFVTICTKGREHYFGSITDGVMILSDIGKAVNDAVINMARNNADIEIPAYVVMPDHLHLIVSIHADFKSSDNGVEYRDLRSDTREIESMVSVAKKQSRLSILINHLKAGVTKYAKANNLTFGWQTRFYDIIISSDEEFNNIVAYINSNVSKWDKSHQ